MLVLRLQSQPAKLSVPHTGISDGSVLTPVMSMVTRACGGLNETFPQSWAFEYLALKWWCLGDLGGVALLEEGVLLEVASDKV